MQHHRWPVQLAAAALMMLSVAGCGGGGGGTSSAVGRVSGNVFLGGSLTGNSRAAATPITVKLEGTNVGTTATSDGRFLIEKAPVGLHTLIAQSGSWAVCAVVNVKKGAETATGDLVLDQAGQISGLVTSSADCKPLAGAKVTITNLVDTVTDTTPPLPVRCTKTDGSGSYTVSGLAPGSYVVAADKAGYVAASLSLDVTAGVTTPGDIQLAADESGANGTLSGSVTMVSDTGTKEPLAGVFVRLWLATEQPAARTALPPKLRKTGSSAASRCETDFFAYTDETGAYKIDGVPAGSYNATAVRPGFQDGSAAVTIAAGKTTTQDFVLQANVVQTGTVAGDVHDSVTGSPIAGAVVGLRMVAYSPGSSGASSNSKSGRCEPTPIVVWPGITDVTVTTDANGHFSLTVPAGSVELYAQANGYELHIEDVDVAAGATSTVSMAVVPLTGTTVTLTGTVVKRTSGGTPQPVADAEVVAGRVENASAAVSCPQPRPDVGYRTKTAADGTFTLTVLAGQYWVSAWSGDLGAAPVAVDATKDASITIEIGDVWAMRSTR